MKVATWNVNSIRARHDALLDWVSRVEPDVLCLQETKVTDDDFPSDELLRLGYGVVTAGQKTYNGVAIAARAVLTDVKVGLVDEPSAAPGTNARLIRATIDGVRIYSVYVPNGKSPTSTSFPEKLAWFRRLRRTLEAELSPGQPALLCGDFNVAPEDRDVYDPDALRGALLFHPEEHRALAGLVEYGLVDVLRRHHEEPGLYSWWDYRAGSFRKNQGFRIDLILATPAMAERCTSASIDVEPRRGDKPSDHTPVIATFD